MTDLRYPRKLLGPVSIGAAVALLALAGCSSQPAPAPSSSTASPGPTSGPTSFEDAISVTINVTGCDDCTVKANWSAYSPTSVPADAWTSGDLKVQDGKVNFQVPGTFASGLSFEVNSPQNSGAESIPIAVVHYSNVPTGQPVTATEASASTSAYGCWAGTTEKQTTLALNVDWIDGKSLEGTAIKTLRAYFNPGLLSIGVTTPTNNGSLGHQNVWTCFP